MGCAQGIRNPQAHPSSDLTEQEALEQLAALSVLARWVDECEVVNAADGTPGRSSLRQSRSLTMPGRVAPRR